MIKIQLFSLLLTLSASVDGNGKGYAGTNDEVLRRLKILEEKDIVNQKKITALESEIATVRNECKVGQYRSHDRDLGLPENNGQRRAIAQTEVAFYAIANGYDFKNMDASINLVYAPPFTNIGNTFNSSTGTFIAPVKGTYVLFGTVGGNIGHFNFFYFDVNGKMLAKIFMGSTAGQGSQTVITTLRPGERVSLKSGQDGDGAYGGYYTSIAGFLLHEHRSSYPVGK